MKVRTSQLLFIAILLGHFLLTTIYSVVNPLAESPDEADHWAYVVHLATERALPVGPRMTQSKHPPFYHATAALIASLATPVNNFLRPNADVEFAYRVGGSPNFFVHTQLESFPWREGVLAFRLARLWSVVLSTLTVAATFALTRQVLPRSPALAYAAAALLAFLPEFAFIGGSVNNDNAAALFGTLALWGAFSLMRNGGRFATACGTALALGFGLLSKTSTLAIWPVVGFAIILGSSGSDSAQPNQDVGRLQFLRNWRNWLKTGCLVFLPAILIALPWLWRNVSLYGDPMGMSMARQTIDLRTTPWTWADTSWLLRGWFVSFWGAFGAIGHIRMPSVVYVCLLLLSLCSAIGIARMLVRWFFAVNSSTKRHLPNNLSAQAKGTVHSPVSDEVGILLLLLALFFTAFGIWQYSLLALGTDQGRLLYPAVAAIVILWVTGLIHLFPTFLWNRVATLLAVGSLLLGLYGVLGVLMPAFAPPKSLAANEWQAAATTSAIQWQELDLVAWQLEPEPILYWQANRAPTQDWRTTLRIRNAQGELVWEWRRSPGAGRWSSDHWQSGVVVRDAYTIRWPEGTHAGTYQVEIGLQPDGQEYVLPTQNGVPAAPMDNPFVNIGTINH